MKEIAVFVAIALSLIVALSFMFIVSGKQWRESQERARARRLADAKMNARLLRLDI